MCVCVCVCVCVPVTPSDLFCKYNFHNFHELKPHCLFVYFVLKREKLQKTYVHSLNTWTTSKMWEGMIKLFSSNKTIMLMLKTKQRPKLWGIFLHCDFVFMFVFVFMITNLQGLCLCLCLCPSA